MSHLIKSMLADDFKEIRNDIPETVTWAGNDYVVTLTEPDVEVDLEEGGFLPEGSFAVKFLTADFPDSNRPESNHRIRYNGLTYKVVSRPESQKADSPQFKVTIAP